MSSMHERQGKLSEQEAVLLENKKSIQCRNRNS